MSGENVIINCWDFFKNIIFENAALGGGGVTYGGGCTYEARIQAKHAMKSYLKYF